MKPFHKICTTCRRELLGLAFDLKDGRHSGGVVHRKDICRECWLKEPRQVEKAEIAAQYARWDRNNKRRATFFGSKRTFRKQWNDRAAMGNAIDVWLLTRKPKEGEVPGWYAPGGGADW